MKEGGASFKHEFVELTPQDYPCHCGRTFSTPQGLARHKRKMHAEFSAEHHLLAGSTCPACFKHLWSTARLQQHLAYVSRRTGVNECFQVLQRRGYAVEFFSQKAGVEVQGLHRVDALQAEGPMLEPRDVHRETIDSLHAAIRTLKKQLMDFPTPGDAASLQTTCRQGLTQIVWDCFAEFRDADGDERCLHQLPDRWMAYLSEYDADFHEWCEVVAMEWGEHDLPDIIAQLVDGEAELIIDYQYAEFVEVLPRKEILRKLQMTRLKLQRLESEYTEVFPHRPVQQRSANETERLATVQEVASDFQKQAQWLVDLRQLQFEDLPPDRPLPRWTRSIDRPTFFIVHLFSGRRRSGDVHDALHMEATRRGIQVVVLSADTAISVEYGNLQQHTTSWRNILRLYRERRVAATIAGTPCETFSEARFHQMEDESKPGPRPLRSKQLLYGLPQLTLRELRQLRQGSAFFLQGVETLCWTLISGGLYISEHPWKPTEADRPSIWSSPIMETLLYHPDLKLHCCAQWRWGATVKKPTGLLALRLPYFLRSMYQRQDPNAQMPTEVAIGRDLQTGNFKTMKHKEYPTFFCGALAGALVDEMVRCKASTAFSDVRLEPFLGQWVEEAINVCKDVRMNAPILPDFQDR